MKKIVLFSLVGLLIFLFSGCGLIPFTTAGEEQPPEVPESLEIGLDPALTLGLVQSKSDSIHHIPSDTSIGSWNEITRIYTLTTYVNGTIKIDEDSLTLDGDGYTIAGSGGNCGVYLENRINTTVKNCVVSNFYCGIRLSYGSSNTLTNNTTNDNDVGISLLSSSLNILTNNRANDNDAVGINLLSSPSNTLTNNTANNNGKGIGLSSSSSNILTNNRANDSDVVGINLSSSSSNILTNNRANNNWWGILIGYSSSNILIDNTVNNNSLYGIYLLCSNYNEIYNNNFIDNSTQAYVDEGSSDNVFSLDKPDGGNYWSDWTSPDFDSDGFVDSPYDFNGGQDNLPWVSQDGWKTILPAEAIGNLITTVEEFELHEGIEKSLTMLLEAVIKSLDNYHEQAAIGQLIGFINHIEGLQNGNKLTEEQADTLIAAAQRIIDSIQ